MEAGIVDPQSDRAGRKMRRVKMRRRGAYLGQTGSFLGRAAGRAARPLIIKKKKTNAPQALSKLAEKKGFPKIYLIKDSRKSKAEIGKNL